ncbi:hypothetical protein ACCAA_670054 [Candidatus Accumulibacter aalborgensis]|uniref:Uncharacterized protein n=1 Tax=Candidatus Accumulibacter aalborgensis TaxID=1860102 RepID=A0A1A8XWN8_9PROT|nr:hypothetical protein ACCAA_670054 [Candidatus Accumulibacter aalborgensis]
MFADMFSLLFQDSGLEAIADAGLGQDVLRLGGVRLELLA